MTETTPRHRGSGDRRRSCRRRGSMRCGCGWSVTKPRSAHAGTQAGVDRSTIIRVRQVGKNGAITGRVHAGHAGQESTPRGDWWRLTLSVVRLAEKVKVVGGEADAPGGRKGLV